MVQRFQRHYRENSRKGKWTTVRNTELPVRKSTEEYKQFLDSIMKTSSKKNELLIKDFKE